MNTDVINVILSLIIITALLAAVVFLHKKTTMSSESLRKLVHILVANWWPLCILRVNNIYLALVGPVVFILVNSQFVFNKKVGEMFGWTDKKRNYGLVYYPMVLFIFVLLVFNGLLSVRASMVGVYCLGLGDGFAALAGMKWGVKKISRRTGGKTYIGSFVMFALCFAVATVGQSGYGFSLGIRLFHSLLVGLVGALTELYTSKGFDNITVPVLCAYCMEAFL